MSTLFKNQVTSAGYVRAPMVDILTALNNLFKAAYGSDLDLDPHSPDGQMVGGLAEMFDDLNGIVFDLVQSLANPNAAADAMLNGLMILTGVPRNGADYATAPAVLSGTNGTVIDHTKVVRSTFDGSLWSPTTDLTISGGVAACTLRCQTIGILPSGGVPAGSLTDIMTPVTGWTSVTNSLGVNGAVKEGNANARVRRQQSVAVASQAMTDGVQAALLKLAGVSQAVVWENNEDFAVPLGTSLINPHSIYAVCKVLSGSSADPTLSGSGNDPIANTIGALRGLGCGTQGAVVKYPVDSKGHTHKTSYDLSIDVAVKTAVVVRKRSNWPLDGVGQIANAIAAWAQGTNAETGKPNIAIGGDSKGNLSWTDVLAAFLNTVHGFDFVSMTFSVDGGSTWSADRANVPLAFNQIASLVSGDVAVSFTV